VRRPGLGRAPGRAGGTLSALRRPAPDDGGAAASLILEAVPSLAQILGDRRTALRTAEAAFRADRTELSHRFALVAEEDGQVAGLAVAFPGRLFGSLKLGTGVAFARSAGARHAAGLVTRGRVLDRLIPPPGREVLYQSVLAVDPARRGRGIASALLARLMAGARGLGLRACLDVALENEGARALYERHGFRVVSVREASPSEQKSIPVTGMARMEQGMTIRTGGGR
jgi:ribosomal protein S18 acetylase RimI-like enzyme